MLKYIIVLVKVCTDQRFSAVETVSDTCCGSFVSRSRGASQCARTRVIHTREVTCSFVGLARSPVGFFRFKKEKINVLPSSNSIQKANSHT